MALVINNKSKKKPTGGFLFPEGIHRVVITAQEDKINEFEGPKKGNHYHNLTLKFGNNKNLFAKVDYMDSEDNLIPRGYNFLLALTEILKKANEDNEDLLEKLETTDSNKVINKLIKDKTHFYVETVIFENEDKEKFAFLSLTTEPVYTLEEAEELAKKRKKDIIKYEAQESTSKEQPEDEDDDL